MAKDDFHVLVYQILAYLYQCLKSGETVNPKQISIGTPQKPRRFIKETIEKNINDYKEIIKEYLSK